MTYYVEVFPKKSSVLRRSVQPAPGLDAKALDLYAHIVAKMPVGVEVNDNFLGAFISGIATIARTAGSWLMSNMGNIAQGAQVVSNIASTVNRSRPIESRNQIMTRNQFEHAREVEEVNSPAILRDRQLAIVHPPPINPRGGAIVSDTVDYKGREVVVQVKPSGITRTTFSPSVSRNIGTQNVRTQKAREKKNRIIDQATKGYTGNRWINQPRTK